MFRIELLFFMQCLLGLLMIIFLHKMSQMKKQVDAITKEVRAYLTFIEEDIREEQKENTSSMKKEKSRRTEKEEVEHRLIQSVLKEYFP